MKLNHRRIFGGRVFESVAHYGFGDTLADDLATVIRKETGSLVRVVQDKTGFRHVFVQRGYYEEAAAIASRRKFL